MLYYFFPSATSEDVKFPTAVVTLHSAMKGVQAGLFSGMVLGVLAGIKKKNLSKSSVLHDMTRFMANGCMAGAGAGIYVSYDLTSLYEPSDYQIKAYQIQHDRWHNRIDTLNVFGMIMGSLLMRRVYRREKIFGVTNGGLAWGGVAGICADVPLSLVLPVYLAHKNDVGYNQIEWFLDLGDAVNQ